MRTPLPDQIVYAEHASDIIAKAAELIRQSRRFVLITSLAIEGGAARETGSLALVEESGLMTGYLSNGCIDKDIQLQALDALATSEKKVIRYGEGSRFLDLKLPCGGALTILIDPAPDHAAILAAQNAFSARETVSLEFSVPSDAGLNQSSFTFTYAPVFRLVLAGRGAIFRAMAQVGRSTGFEVAAISPDLEDLDAVRAVTTLTSQHLTTPDTDIALDVLDPHSAFVTLFHDHDWEPFLLKSALKTKAHFIGSLGSRRTHQMRLETLRGLGVADDDLSRLQGPIGLVPSLRNASFIAVSAISEIIGTIPNSISPTRQPNSL